MGFKYFKTQLDSGVRILTEEFADFPTVSVGLWLNVGSRDEEEHETGLTHFIEHLFFKGTKKRSALQIAKELDRLGGYSNAFTSKEQTCIHAKVLPEHTSRFLELLADIFLNSNFSAEDIEREKQVVLQEIKMMEDSPEELVHELFSQTIWENSPLARSILGTWENVASFDEAKVKSYFAKFYNGQNLVIAAAGNLKHEEFAKQVATLFADVSQGEGKKRIPPSPQRRVAVISRKLEQVHFVLGVPVCSARDEMRYQALLFNTLLGGSMSSRLFQEIREKRALAYAIYSFLSLYEDTGVLGIYAAVEKRNLKEALRLITKEIENLKDGNITEEEFSSSLDHLKSALLLSSDNPDTRMSRLARNEFLFKRYIPYEETLAKIKELRPKDIASFAKKSFRDKPTLAILGPLTEEEGTKIFEDLTK
ncbi:M16 family metallopeptidase [Thermodesulfatator atlanticus]|uniref:M16 family metallopeptidase n=1 Tax=Thermodesulfatator atlanticus TaxID=501497 RepID=UPI00048F7AF3|nr:pitrilysin family protein [Thermodesulfatator atlanticus]